MTESEWLACTDPQPMLEFLRTSGRLSQRKARLFAVAVCRRIWPLLADQRSRKAVEVAELFADDLADARELAQVSHAASAATEGPFDDTPLGQCGANLHAAMAAWWSTHVNLSDYTDEVCIRAYGATVCDPEDPEVEEPAQAYLLRDIVFPFRPLPPIDRSLLAQNDGLVVRLAEAAYEERQLPEGTLDTGRLGVLADSLEDAGCTDTGLLGHLRGPGPHVRGCFAVDAVLGRS